MSRNIIVPKRKRDDDSDDEQPHHALAKQQRMFAIPTPASEATTPSPLPIPGSCKERYMSINFRYSPLPKYRRVIGLHFVETIKYITFVKAIVHMRALTDLSPLSRTEMEAAWYQKIAEVCRRRSVSEKHGGATECQKLGRTEYMMRTAMSQRRDESANRWWEEQKKKHPDLDVEVVFDNQEADKMQARVDAWMAMTKDGLDPLTQYPFRIMTPAQVNFIKITCEEASRVKEAANPGLAFRPKFK